MTAIDLHKSGFSLKSLSNYDIVLFAQIFNIRSLPMSVLMLFVLKPSFFARLSVCCRQRIKFKSQKIATVDRIASTMQINI